MGRVLNLMAFVIFATTLFMRSVDPVIPQIAAGLNVAPTTAALLSTGFTLPYALVQPVLGALADMFSKARLIAVCMLVVGIATIACGLATNFEMLMTLRVIAGIAAGGVFPIALAVAGDRVPVQQRQVAIGRLLFAAMTGNLLGASGAGVIGDVVGWRGVFFVTGAIDLVALAVAMPGFRSMNESPGRFDLSTFIPNYRAVFSNPLAKYCFGAVFIEALFLFGVFPYMAVLLQDAGEPRASIAGVVIAGFGIGGVIYTMMVMACRAHKREKIDGDGRHGNGCLSSGDYAWYALASRIHELHADGFWFLPAAWMHPGLCHGAGAIGAWVGHRGALYVFLSWSGRRPRSLRCRSGHCRNHARARGRSGRIGGNRMDLRAVSSAERLERLATSTIGRDALIRHPHVFRKFSGLPKHINRHSATRIPVAADAQPFRLEQRKQSLADRDRAIFVESAVIAEAVEIELQRLRFDKETRRYVVNDQMGKIRLPGDRTQSGEFRRGKSRHIIRSGMRVCHAIKDSLVG